MAQTITVGQVEALFRLKDEMSSVLKSIQGETKKTGDAFSGLSGAAFVFNNVTDAVSRVYGWVKTAAGAFVDLAERGGQVSAVSNSFEQLSKAAGETGSQLLGAVREGTKGLVSDFDIMLAANKAMLLGLPVTSKEFGTLSNAALVLGKTMGLTTAQALNDLVTGLGRGSAAILDNLGITIKAEDAYKRYADALGKDVSALTAAEQKTAIYKAAVEGAAASVAKIGDVQLTFADRMTQAKVGLQNFTDSLGMAIARSPVLNELMGQVSKAILDAFGTNQQATVKLLINIIDELAIGVVTLSKAAVQTAAFIANAFNGLKFVFASVVEGVLFAVEKTLSGIQSIGEFLAKLPGEAGKAFAASAAEIGGMADAVALSKAQLSDYTSGILDTIQKTENAKNASVAWLDKLQASLTAAKGKVIETGNAFTAPQGPVEGAKMSAEAAKKLADILADNNKRLWADLQKIREAEDDRFKSLQDKVAASIKADQERSEATKKNAEEVADLHRKLWEDQQQAIFDASAAALDFGDVLGGALGTAFNAAGNLLGAFGSIRGALDSMKTASAQGGLTGLLGQIGGIGSIASTVIGVGKGLFNAIFGGAKKAREEMEKLRGSFVQSQGGMVALSAKAKEAGVSLDAMFKAKNAKQLQSAIDGIKNGLDSWDQAQEKLNAAIEEYGFTIEELGPKMAQQKLDEQAASLLEKYELLTAAGVDHNAILARMGPDFNAYVNTAIAAGQSIPESMRKVIDELIATGQLLDANGNAYTSAEEAGITYTQTMSEQFAGLMEQIEKLVAALAKGFNVPVNFNTSVSQSGESPGIPGHAAGAFIPELPRDYTFRAHKGEALSVTPASVNPNRMNVRDYMGWSGGVSSGKQRPIELRLDGRRMAVEQAGNLTNNRGGARSNSRRALAGR